MDLNLKNSVVLVTGSSKGIGRAIAESFLSEGARVTISGRQRKDLDETYEELSAKFNPDNIMCFKGDLTDKESIKSCLKMVLNKWGAIDILIENVGSGKVNKKQDGKEWHRVFQLNFGGAVEITSKAIPIMQVKKKGSIVFVASIAGLESIGAPLPYAAAKAALIAYAKNLSREVASKNIRVNTVAPGNVKFPGGRWEEIINENPSILEMIKREVPMGRFGKPDEIASAVTFLASNKASFITGACVVVDGGQTKSI